MDTLWAIYDALLSAASKAFVFAATWSVENAGLLFLFDLLILCLVAAFFFHLWRKKPINLAEGDKEEMRKRRLAQLKDRWGDKLHDILLDDLVQNKITSKEYREALQDLGLALGIRGLVRRGGKKKTLIAKVKYHTASMKAAMANIKPGVIPGPKPQEVVTFTPEVVTGVGARFLKRHASV